MAADPKASTECRPVQGLVEGKAVSELVQEEIQRLYRLSVAGAGLALLLGVEAEQAVELEVPTEVEALAVYIAACKAELHERQSCWQEIAVVQRIV